ncbi:MAG TPA: hypothetical protein VFP14_09645, partial [Novosphingobium sp.]|nr:hypothetical protein [Novosphingobium sp.]
AAGLPLSGAVMSLGTTELPNADVIARLKDVPVWAIHGNDGAQLWDEAMAQALPSDTAYRYTENLSLAHDVWDTYYPLPASPSYSHAWQGFAGGHGVNL